MHCHWVKKMGLGDTADVVHIVVRADTVDIVDTFEIIGDAADRVDIYM